MVATAITSWLGIWDTRSNGKDDDGLIAIQDPFLGPYQEGSRGCKADAGWTIAEICYCQAAGGAHRQRTRAAKYGTDIRFLAGEATISVWPWCSRRDTLMTGLWGTCQLTSETNCHGAPTPSDEVSDAITLENDS